MSNSSFTIDTDKKENHTLNETLKNIEKTVVTKEKATWIINTIERRSILKNLDFSGLNLTGANFEGLKLYHVSFSGADLTGAVLDDSFIYESIFDDAKLIDASMRFCDVNNSSFARADLSQSKLSCANLFSSIFTSAKFINSNLYRANVHKSILEKADFTNANMFYLGELDNAFGVDHAIINWPMCCPEKGSFIGWKKCYSYKKGSFIVKLEIPKDAKRSSGTERKCRCDKAIVKGIFFVNEFRELVPSTETTVLSTYNHMFKYRLGETVHVDDFDDNRWHICAPGIHFFMSEEEAIMY